MANDSITSANAIFTIVVSGLFPAPQQLAGFSTDRAFVDEAIPMAEVQMGVDGRMTAGMVFSPTPMTITLQADSPSRSLFTTIIAATKTAKTVYYLTGTITLPSTGESFTLTRGVLTHAKQIPDAQKVLQPVDYQITWESINRSML